MGNTAQVLEDLRATLPPIFAGQNLDELTGGAIVWRTILNSRAKKQVPAACFVRSGKKVLVLRDEFLKWWAGTLREEVANDGAE
jgi:hypothetical protein